MPHFPKPWFRAQTATWYVQLAGRQFNLGQDQTEAFRLYHELMTKHRPGDAAPEPLGRSPSLVAIFDRFQAWLQANRAPATADLYQGRLQSFLDALPNQALTVAALKPLHVQEWVDGHTWGDATKRGRIMAVQTALNWAVHQGIIASSPLAGFRKPGQGRRENAVTLEEWPKLIALVKTLTLRDMLIVAWETGARPQELRKVERCHVDLKTQRWVFQMKKSKGKKLPRVVHLTQLAADISARLCKLHPTGPIFRNADGLPWTPFAMNCAMCRLGKRFGRKVAFVDLRHGFGTRMLKAGNDAITVAALMGHKDPSMLAKVYSHVHADAPHLKAALNRGAREA